MIWLYAYIHVWMTLYAGNFSNIPSSESCPIFNRFHPRILWEPSRTLKEPTILEFILLWLATLPIIMRICHHSQCLRLQIQSPWVVLPNSLSVLCSSWKDVYSNYQPYFTTSPSYLLVLVPFVQKSTHIILVHAPVEWWEIPQWSPFNESYPVDYKSSYGS